MAFKRNESMHPECAMVAETLSMVQLLEGIRKPRKGMRRAQSSSKCATITEKF
jgi:hypothetical protein